MARARGSGVRPGPQRERVASSGPESESQAEYEAEAEGERGSEREPDLLDPRDPDPERRDQLLHWLRVQAAFALRPQDACTALRAGVSPEALWKLAAPSARTRAERLDPDGPVWRSLEQCGARALPLSAPGYPLRLCRLSDAPPVLLVQGRAELVAARSVAIVGARAATAYGRRIAFEIAAELARAGVVVVSGLARGIDAQAHLGALQARGPTLAVQARGPDGVYPAAHRALAQRIRSSGALISEFPPGVPPLPAHFPLRNRIISALSLAVVVVEARVRSGSLVTARHALDQGVDVLAVPGPIDAPTSAGPNALLRDGAGAVLEPADVLAAIGVVAAAPEPASSPAAVGGRAREVIAALCDRTASRDELAVRLGCQPEELALALAELELAGAIGLERDGRFRRVGPA